MPSIETIAISKLITSEEYTRKVLPFIKEDYFETLDMKTLFGEINDYFTKYDQVPEINALKIEIDKRKDLSQEIVTEIEKFLDENIDYQQYNDDWLVETTEILNTSTRLQKVDYLARLSMSHLLVQVSESLYSCAMLLVPVLCRGETFSISHLKWQKRKLLNELTATSSTSRSNS